MEVNGIPLCDRITIDYWMFELRGYPPSDYFYECRGALMYDQDHDETPEPDLWRAAGKLAEILTRDGLKVERTHSEKGWVEVQILNVN